MTPVNRTALVVNLRTWAALLVLLALTVASSALPLGRWHLVCNLAIAGLKTALVMLFFMQVRRSSPLIRLFSVAAFFWIALLIGLTLIDDLTRTTVAAPW
jgi:cytochrome c oxidase subunit 4